MSASAKKKLRKEQNAVKLTEKQLKEQKEVKKLKLYTSIFVIAIAVVLVTGLVFAGVNYYKNSGIAEKNTVAAVIGDKEISSVELSYYYNDAINRNYNEWYSSYGDSLGLFMTLMGLDINQPLDAQEFSEGVTWAEYFMEIALEKAKSDYMLSEAAEKAGFALSVDEEETFENSLALSATYASLYGYPDFDTYLKTVYGPGASEESYRDYTYKANLASVYYTNYSDSVEVDEAAIRAYDEENYDKYNSFSFVTYRLGYSDYLAGGVEGEDGNMIYTAEEENAARAMAKAEAERLAKFTTVEELDQAIAALPVNADNANAKSTVYSNALYTSISSIYRDWLNDSSRKAGDCTVISSETTVTAEDGSTSTVINDYYVVLFQGREDNNRPLANIRHILVDLECNDPENHMHADDGHTHTEDDHEHIEYTAEEKAAAYAKAEEILNEYLAGAKTDESFAALATEHTDDTASASTGGLYEDIAPKQGVYVESFTNWAVDSSRVAGDTGIIESEYGYHVMYYVGDDDLTYRESMIIEALRSETLNNWYNDIVEKTTASLKDTSLMDTDKVLANEYSA